MKTENFIHEMTQCAAIFGRREDVRVHFEGDQAYTDGKDIHLPALPQGYLLNDKALRIMRAYTDHEGAGHVLNTDWVVSGDFFKECIRDNRPALKDIVNCVEDMFVERKVMEQYPGAQKNFRELSNHTNKKSMESFEGHEEELKEINHLTVCSTILSKGRSEYAPETAPKMLGMMPEKLQEFAEVWQKEVDKVECTSDSISLSKAIYKLIREDPNLESDPEDFDPTDGDLSDIEEGDENLTPQEGEGQPQLMTAVEAVADAISEADKESDEPGMIKPDGEQVSGYKVLTTKYDTVLHRRLPKPNRMTLGYNSVEKFFKGTVSGYTASKAGVQSYVNVMKTKIQRALLAKDRRDWDTAREQGRLDSKRLVSGYRGNPHVFKMRKDREEMDTSVSILIDCSGSMGDRIKLAKSTAIVLAECLEGSGIHYEIAGFTNWWTGGEAHREKAQEIPYGEEYHRVDGLVMYLFKEYRETLREAKPALSTIADVPLADNSDRDAVLWMHERLKQRPEKRKVLVVLSDGVPCNSKHKVSFGDLSIALEEAVKEVSKTVECIGIGIQTGAVGRFYPKNVVVNDLTDLSGTVLKELSSLLVGNRLQL